MKSRFPASLFAIYLGVLLLMSGVHVGLIVLMNKLECHDIIQVTVALIYWFLVASALTLFTREKIRKTYEEPMQNLAQATKRVANGDFSVYIPTINTMDKLDYLDVMILDFNKMVEELGSIETLKTDFVSNVSHEMKTPIAIIKNYGELLKKEGLPEGKRMEYAITIEEAAVRLSNLIGNILKLNKLENQRIVPECEAYDVSRQLCDCLLQYEETWEEKDIEIDVDVEDSIYVVADASLLELVWNNLFSNAFKFTEKGGSVTLRCTVIQSNHPMKNEETLVVPSKNERTLTEAKNMVEIVVADTGCGMSEDVVKHIFDKFYQGDTSHSGEGNGLGMALVKRVIELIDGKIRVESEEGKGSRFIVTLPMAVGNISTEK